MKRTAIRRSPIRRTRSKPRPGKVKRSELHALYESVFARDGWKCRNPECGKYRNGLHPHHIIYKSHGGPDTMENLITLCNSCHLQGIHGGRLWIVGDANTAQFVIDNPKRRIA